MSLAENKLKRLSEEQRSVLLRVANRILGDSAEAEDVLQDTLAAVLGRLEKAEIKDLKAYLFRAVHVNALKRRARRKTHIGLDQAPEPAAAEDEGDEFEIDPLELEGALLGLPPTQQAVIRMKYYLGFTFRQIGETLSVSSNTAASRCRYGLDAMRRTLGEIRSMKSEVKNRK